MAVTNSGSTDLHSLAVDTSQNLHMLATGLSQVGAPPHLVDELSQTSQMIGEIAKALANPQGAPGGAQPPGPPQAAPPPPSPTPPPHGQPQAPPAPAGGPPQDQAAHHTLHAATQALGAAMSLTKGARQPTQ